MKHFVNVSVMLGIVLAAMVARADTTCTTNLNGVAINGNLIVPDGATCKLANATVTGNVLVGHGAAFTTIDNVTISGNVQADHCASVSLTPSLNPVSVGGNVEIEHCTGPDFSGYFAAPVVGATVTIAGNFSCHNNSATCQAFNGSVGGNAVVSDNSGGTSVVTGNTIGGNLQCVGNDAVTGLPNTVAGQKLGQCAAL